jgi:hypothetical protein
VRLPRTAEDKAGKMGGNLEVNILNKKLIFSADKILTYSIKGEENQNNFEFFYKP